MSTILERATPLVEAGDEAGLRRILAGLPGVDQVNDQSDFLNKLFGLLNSIRRASGKLVPAGVKVRHADAGCAISCIYSSSGSESRDSKSIVTLT